MQLYEKESKNLPERFATKIKSAVLIHSNRCCWVPIHCRVQPSKCHAHVDPVQPERHLAIPGKQTAQYISITPFFTIVVDELFAWWAAPHFTPCTIKRAGVLVIAYTDASLRTVTALFGLPALCEKKSLCLSVNVFCTEVPIEDTVFTSLLEKRTAISTWSSKPREGLTVC